MCVCINLYICWLFGCYGISTCVGYLTHNLFYFKQFSFA